MATCIAMQESMPKKMISLDLGEWNPSVQSQRPQTGNLASQFQTRVLLPHRWPFPREPLCFPRNFCPACQSSPYLRPSRRHPSWPPVNQCLQGRREPSTLSSIPQHNLPALQRRSTSFRWHPPLPRSWLRWQRNPPPPMSHGLWGRPVLPKNQRIPVQKSKASATPPTTTGKVTRR